MVRRSLSFILAAAFTIAPIAAQADDPIVLRFGFPAPPQSKVNVWGVTPWIEDVQKEVPGMLDIKVFPGPSLASVENSYDRLVTGVADLMFGIFGPLAGKFAQVTVGALPFESRNNTETAKAYWELHKKGMFDNELRDVKTLALFTFPSAGFHTNKPITSAADLAGMKVAVSDRALSQLITSLGAVPITMGPPDFYQAMQRGLVSGVAVGWSAADTFKLYEVSKYHVDTASGLFTAFMFMNKASFAKLPANAQAAIDKYSGEPFFRRMGKVTDDMDVEGREKVRAMPGQVLSKIDPAEEARWQQKAQPIVEAWVKDTPNGAALLTAFREEIKKARAGM
jgi:TRAP-type C4-dicarboxylate transport system substrate-binding protein